MYTAYFPRLICNNWAFQRLILRTIFCEKVKFIIFLIFSDKNLTLGLLGGMIVNTDKLFQFI